jgi:hypothetical protein
LMESSMNDWLQEPNLYCSLCLCAVVSCWCGGRSSGCRSHATGHRACVGGGGGPTPHPPWRARA